MQLLGQHHLIVLSVLQLPVFALFLALDSTQTSSISVCYHWFALPFLGGDFLLFICKCLFLENWQRQ